MSDSSQQEPTGELVERDNLFPEQDDDFAAPRKPVTARGVAIASARVVTGIIGIAVAAATLAAAALVPLPGIRVTPPSAVVVPVPTAQQLVCPGAVLRLSDETGQGATTASAIGRPDVAYSSSTGSIAATPLGISDASTGGTPAAPIVVSTPPDKAAPNQQLLVSGAQAQSVAEDEFVGLAAADCGVANGDSWLAGGATTVGRTTLLTLSNPTEVPATVDIDMFGENGAIPAPGTSGIIVPALGQRVLSLAGFQPDVASPVVHVSSSGGQVVADLQEAVVRGLDAGGVDIVEPTTAPALVNVIPGLVVQNSAAVQALLGRGGDYKDLPAILRLFAPGTGTIPVTITVIPEDGAANGASVAYDLEAGRVVDLPFNDLSDGNYTVKVTSSKPVLAAARVSTAIDGGPNDVAWLAAAPPLTGHALVTIAPGPTPVLHLANEGTSAATVVLTARDGASSTIPVAAGSSALVPVQPGETYAATGFDTLFAAVSLGGGGTIARYAVHPAGAGSTPLTVYR